MKLTISTMMMLTSAFMLTGCPTSVPEATQLNVVITGLQQPAEKNFFRTFIKLFEAEHGISVTVTYESADLLFNRLKEEQGANVVTDVIMLDTAHMGNFLDENFLQPIDWLEEENNDRTLTDFFDPYTSRLGVTYFAPISFDVYMTLINRESLPYIPSTVQVTRDVQDVIARIDSITWQEISEWAIAIRQATGTAKFGFPYARISSQLLYPITGIAAAMATHDFPSFDDDGAAAAWNYLADLKAANAIAYNATIASVNQPTELMTSNQLWLSFGHMGPLGNAYIANPSKYILAPAPIDATTQRAGSTAGAWAYGIVEGAPHVNAARQWLKFITDPEINYLYCSGLGGVISPIEEVVDHLGTSPSDTIMRNGISMFSNGLKVVIVDTSPFTVWDDVKLLYNDLYDELLTGEPITSELRESYQTALDALRKPS